MKIGLVATELPPSYGGMQQVALGLARALAATDQVTLFGPKNTCVHDSAFEFRPIASRSPKRNGELLAQEDVDVWLLLNAALIGGAYLLKRPVVAYVHGNDFLNPWLKSMPRSGEDPADVHRPIRTGLSAVDRVIANSQMTAAQFRKLFPQASERISVICPGVSDAFFTADRPLRAAELSLLTVARLDPRAAKRKNIDMVLEALARVPRMRPIHYYIAGDGADRQRLEALALELRVADRVTFLGYVDHDHLPELYRKADLFVMLPKILEHDIESFGIVFLEAMASGTQVLCSEDAGAAEVLGDDVVLLRSPDPDSIAKALVSFGEGAGHIPAERLRAAAQRFTWPRVAARVREVLVQATC